MKHSNQNKMTDYLDQILEIAARAHDGQLRKYTGEHYILHPIAVAELVADKGGSLEMQAAALLHDVLEDTLVTHAELRTKLHQLDSDRAEAVLALVVELTDVYTKESFPELNRKQRKELEAQRLAKCSSEARAIKRADMQDNTSSILARDPTAGIDWFGLNLMIFE
jgi:(p)ppGpp synthase/HD superfamily hydrolase